MEDITLGKIIKFILILFLLSTIIGSIGYGLGWFSEAATVAKTEFGAKASLKKYEWFKDCSNTIEEKRNSIKLYEANLKNIDKQYEGVKRKDWDDFDKAQYNQWSMEIVGIKASYNKVVKEYNSQSDKFNWAMYNTSDLPRSYDLYLNE